MKIFTNKKYNEIINEYEEKFNLLISRINELTEEKYDKEITIGKLIEEKKSLEKKIQSSRGGFNAKINKQDKLINELTEKAKELEKKLEEAMSDKYLRKKLPGDKSKGKQTMKVKDCSKISNIARKAYGRQEE